MVLAWVGLALRCVGLAVAGAAGLGAGLLVAIVAELDLVHNHDRESPCGLILLPFHGLLVVTADDVDIHAFFQLHLFDALADTAEGFDVEVDPAAVVLTTLVINRLPDPKTDAGSVLDF